MSKINFNNIEGYSSFKENKEIKFFRCEDEYPGWTGTEKFIIVTDIPEEDLLNKYFHVMNALRPYMILDSKYGEVRDKSLKIERSINRFVTVHQTGYDFDEDTEYCNEELIEKTLINNLDLSIDLEKALSCLSEREMKRLVDFYFKGFSLMEISDEEDVSISAVYQSIRAAKIKIKNFMK